jgi:hypothetical protein
LSSGTHLISETQSIDLTAMAAENGESDRTLSGKNSIVIVEGAGLAECVTSGLFGSA